MKRVLMALPLVILAAGCQMTDSQSTATGAVAGAALGAATTDSATGALVGGAAGAVAGHLIGKANRPGRCIYRDSYGRQYTARCR